MEFKKIILAALIFTFTPITLYAAPCDQPTTQAEINECAKARLESETEIINSTYNRYRAELDAAQRQQLKDAQLAWIRYKDLACKFDASSVAGGSMEPYVVAHCLTEQTIFRRKQLEAKLRCNPVSTLDCSGASPYAEPTEDTIPPQSEPAKKRNEQTATYGNCPLRADFYQNRYNSSAQASDLVCFQRALQRELSGEQKFSCPLSAQHYQTAYERNANSSDLVCYQQALERELR